MQYDVPAVATRAARDGLRPAGTVRHVAAVTGLKDDLGPFEAYGKGTLPQTQFREDQGRLDIENFYYPQEDDFVAAAKRDGFTWSIHRPHTGHWQGRRQRHEPGNNAGGLCSTLPRDRASLPLSRLGGTMDQPDRHDDARQLAKHLLWAATTPAASDQAFNVVNGDVFRWNWMWSRIAEWFDLEPAPFDGSILPLEEQMKADTPIWRQIAEREGLIEPALAVSHLLGTRMPISDGRSRT